METKQKHMTYDAQGKSNWHELRCRIHPNRPIAALLHGAGTEACQACLDEFYTVSYAARDDFVIGWLERRFVLCPGCAHEEAVFEDAQRELDAFLQTTAT